MAVKTIEKYGAKWSSQLSELQIEMAAIKKGGKWKNKAGEECGLGLFAHYKAMQMLLWPEEDNHRWSDLILKEILENTITCLSGPKDSGKTHAMAKYGLCDYWCFPTNTLIIISSTDIRSLEGRVWGDIKAMWRRAKERHPWLPGVILDSKHAISTDDLDDEDVTVRDLRKGILCFKEGSMVDTPSGPKPIEQLSVGDMVFNVSGVGTILNTFKRKTDVLCRVKLQDGRILECTPEHKIFTNYGWVKACNLSKCHYIYSIYESMQILRNPHREQCLLQQSLSREMDDNFRSERDVLHQGTRKENIGFQIPMAQTKPRTISLCCKEDARSYAARRSGKSEKSGAGYPFNGMETEGEMRERNRPYSHRESLAGNIPRIHKQLSSINTQKGRKWLSTTLQDRCRIPRNKACDRNRWTFSQPDYSEGRGQKENGIVNGSFVDSVTIYKQTSDGEHQTSGRGYTVYNLEVKGHPSYSVNGLTVHNCIPCKTSSGTENNIASYVGIKQERRRYLADEMSFMSSAMFNSLGNVNAGNFKMVAAGNPIGMDDPLDKLSEPEGGWDSIGTPEKTCVWKNKLFLDSKTVCLVGTDSPNFDYPETEPVHYWYLVNRDSIARTVAGYGKDSPQYWSQCVGVRRAGMVGSRIITETLCRQHHAFDGVEWDGGKPTTKVAGLDAAYGGVGGDRCIIIWGEFGTDVNGKTILLIHPPAMVPVSVRLPKKPEDQIAEWVMNYCIGLGIPPENLFYDSTGRGTLGLAFARAWSDQVNGVEFGGAPSNRIVSADMFITDMKTLRSRPLLCNEHYFNFVSELWYSVRYAIEADQIRGLPTDVAQEGYARLEMKPVRAKLQVEPKSGKGGMKERVGFSPDKFDALVTMVEGARRRGFVISKLGEGKRSGSNSEWLRKWQDEHRRIDKAHELNYAV